MTNRRIYLSSPDVGESERSALLRAFDDGYIAPVGEELDLFESEIAAFVGTEACVALTSGTAGLHLALLAVGVEAGDDVVVQSATFAATAFAVAYVGANPIFIDSERETWGLDPALLADYLKQRARVGRLPTAVIAVDLYGSCCDYVELTEVCAKYEVPLIEDAAEALGSVSTTGRFAGELSDVGIFSFNGNKIITTSGGGALVGPASVVERARYLATQARQPVRHYEHTDIGFNYRMSNLLAAIGRAQLSGLEAKINRRAEIYSRYVESFPDFAWCPYGSTSKPNQWLAVALLPEHLSPGALCEALDQRNIEARPAWKPMHMQPVFAGVEMVGGEVSESIFDRGLCLPSGSVLTDDEVEQIIDALSAHVGTRPCFQSC